MTTLVYMGIWPSPITIYTREINTCLDHRNTYLDRAPASFSQLSRLAMSKLPCEGPRKITIYISFLQGRMQMGNASGLMYWICIDDIQWYSMIFMVEMIWNDMKWWVSSCDSVNQPSKAQNYTFLSIVLGLRWNDGFVQGQLHGQNGPTHTLCPCAVVPLRRTALVRLLQQES